MEEKRLNVIERGQRPTCPVCGAEKAVIMYTCNECNTKVADKLPDGRMVLLDPELMDRSKKYKVEGFSDGRAANACSEFYPGDVVEFWQNDKLHRLTDCSSHVYVDGIGNVERFVMPERDVYITRSESGMAMNSTRFYGPHGELLRGAVFCSENIIREGEDPTPVINISMMGMGIDGGMMAMQNMMNQSSSQTMKAGEKITCPECKLMTRAGNFCENCGSKLVK